MRAASRNRIDKLLRQWKTADRKPYAALHADPAVMEYFPASLSRQKSDASAQYCEDFITEHGWGPWATQIKATGEFIGMVGLNIPEADLPISPCVEVLWRLARGHWHHGFATEAAQGALQVAFVTLQFPEIVSFTVPANTRSRAVMERLGMKMDPHLFEHPAVPAGHELRTHYNYRLTQDSWFARAAVGSGSEARAVLR